MYLGYSWYSSGDLGAGKVDSPICKPLRDLIVVTKQEKLTAVFSALADPTRRRILERLSKQRDVSVSKLAKPFRMSLPAISRHLKVLEEANLIRRERQGRVHNIRAHQQGLRDAQKWIAEYAQFWEARFDTIDELLKEKSKNEDKDQT